MKIDKNGLFYGLFFFLLIIDILSIFDINNFFIRNILSSIFILIVPGYLLILNFKIRSINLWKYIVYILGLSISFSMVLGLLINLILPWFYITDTPLSLIPVLISYNVLLMPLIIIGRIRNEDLKPLSFNLPKIDILNRILFIIPITFPIVSILGAFILNNHGSNILNLILVISIVIYVTLIITLRNRLNKNIFPWAIFLITLSLFFMFSMRSWYVNGGDVNKEFFVYQLTESNQFWSLDSLKTNYNAMLSISIFPTILSIFIKINPHYIFKIYFPILFAIAPVTIYLIAVSFFEERIAFLSSFFFVSQQVLFNWVDLPTRQEVAFIFFALTILASIEKEFNLLERRRFFLIFGFSMVVSHYSTSYIAIAILVLTYLVGLIISTFFSENDKRLKTKNIKKSQNNSSFYTVILILVIVLFGFLWNNQITSAGDGLILFMQESSSSFGDIFEGNSQADGKNILDRFNPFSKNIDKNEQLDEYISNLESRHEEETSIEISTDYIPRFTPFSSQPQLMKSIIVDNIYLFFELLKRVMYLFILFGVISILLSYYKNRNFNKDYLSLLIGSFIIFGLLVLLPFISIKYSLLRAYQQFLIILAPMAVLGVIFIFKKVKKKDFGIRIFLIFSLIFFLFMSGFIPQLIGGSHGYMRLSNENSLEYDLYYTHEGEIRSLDWLFLNYQSEVYLDLPASSRLGLSKYRNFDHRFFPDILPNILKKNSYVYLTYSNINNKIIFNRYKNSLLSYNSPDVYLNNNKNKVYSNGESEIYK